VSQHSEADPKDSRFRRYRQAMIGLYTVLTVAFCLHLIVSVVRSTQSMTFGPERAAVLTRTDAECSSGLRALWQELETQRGQMASGRAVDAEQSFLAFRVGWFPRFRTLEAACAPGRPPQKALFADVERLADLYTTLAIRYAGEAGPTVDRVRSGLDAR
jgi:hypothetical protein